MKKLHFLCEGQTEWTIVRDVLEPRFTCPTTFVTSTILTTRRTGSAKAFKGGVSKWSRIHAEIRTLLRDSSLTVLTTCLDYYGLPRDAPGLEDLPVGPARARVEHVEKAMGAAVDDPRFVPHLVQHETEAWVLACPEELEVVTNEPGIAAKVRALVQGAGGPEAVNDSPATAPSKRLMRLCPSYDKVAHGPQAIGLADLDDLRRQCPHTDTWFRDLDERLGIGRTN